MLLQTLLIWSARGPDGTPPPSGGGAMFDQKIVWFKCPPPLKLIAAATIYIV